MLSQALPSPYSLVRSSFSERLRSERVDRVRAGQRDLIVMPLSEGCGEDYRSFGLKW